MPRLCRFGGLALAALLTGAFFGCKKAAEDPAVLQGAATLPGAKEVMAAVEKKDYDGAMAALMKAQAAAATEDQKIQFMVLARQARDKINESGATDAKAAQTVAALRAMTTGIR